MSIRVTGRMRLMTNRHGVRVRVKMGGKLSSTSANTINAVLLPIDLQMLTSSKNLFINSVLPPQAINRATFDPHGRIQFGRYAFKKLFAKTRSMLSLLPSCRHTSCVRFIS